MLSRVADHLYWMSRYLERAEHTARVLSVSMSQTLEGTVEPATRCQRLLQGLGLDGPEGDTDNPNRCTYWLAFEPHSHSSVLSTISEARENARQVREQISSEMWEQLNRLYHAAHREASDGDGDLTEFLLSVMNGTLLFQGVTASTMNRGEGWRFIRLGQFIERAGLLTTLLDAHTRLFPANDLEPGTMAHPDWLGLLHSAGAFEAYAKVHTARLNPLRIVEFLLLDPAFPHSVRFAANQLEEALLNLPEGARRGTGQLRRLAGKLNAQLTFAQVDEIVAMGLGSFLRDLAILRNQVHTVLQEVYITYPIESAIAS